jgi:serine/threonine protein kinase
VIGPIHPDDVSTGSGPAVELPRDPVDTYRPREGTAPDLRSSTAISTQIHLRPGDKTPVLRRLGEDPEPSHYELLKVVGRGGMGEVWEAVQSSLGRNVAVKRIRFDRRRRASSDAASERLAGEFLREAAIAGRLEHPNIVPVHDLSRDRDGNPLLAMKLVKGEKWDHVLERDLAAMPPDEVLAKHLPFLLAVAQAVAYAHSRGVIHRDIKPGQVMLGEFGEVVLMDWGLAVDVRSEAEIAADPSTLEVPTRATALNPCGTPSMMAPEQTEDTTANLGPWTDVFLLGGTLYYLLTGTYPHAGTNSAAAMIQASEGRFEDPRRRASGRMMPQQLVDLCIAAMVPDRHQRMDSAAKFADTLRAYLTGAIARADSAALSGRAKALLRHEGSTPTSLPEIERLVEEALHLWPQNHEARELRHEILALHAELASGRREYAAARGFALRMREGEERESLLLRIDTAAADAKRQALTSRRVLVAAVAALMVTTLLGFGFAIQMQREVQRLQAEAAQAR